MDIIISFTKFLSIVTVVFSFQRFWKHKHAACGSFCEPCRAQLLQGQYPSLQFTSRCVLLLALTGTGHTSFEGTYMYGMSLSSHSTGKCVMTSIGEISPAIMQILQLGLCY